MPTAAGSRDFARKVASLLDRLPTLAAAILTALAVGALVVWQLTTKGRDLADIDYLLISGVLTTLGGLWLARGQAERFDAMFERLVNRNALEGEGLTDERLAKLRKDVRDRALRWSTWSGIAFALLLPLVWIVVNATREDKPPLFDAIAGPLVGAVGGFLVGRVLGRMLSYGLLGSFLEAEGVTFAPRAGHVDGAAGLKPVGDYYLYQALLLALPAVFLLFWSFMLAVPEWDREYKGWRETYLGLLALAILLEIFAFVAPMWHAHTAMKKAKRDALENADKNVAGEIAKVRAELETKLPPESRSEAQDRLDRLTARFEAAETMPTWPIDRALRRRVTLGNAGLVLGLVGQAVALGGWS